MDRNIGDQLNKAFEAYRQVSIEKDNAQKELQKMGNVATVAGASNLTVNSSSDYQDMLAAFEAIQGKFRQIQTLTTKQKHHLKRFHGSYDNSNDQRFSMPIQCTDGTVEAERPFPTPLRLTADVLPAPLASRGTSREDRDLVDSLTKLSVKFPPPTDSEYDFLNSAPERNIGLPVARKPPLGSPTLPEEEPVELPLPFVYPTSPSHSSSASPSHESVRGPEQPRWTPELCDAVDMGANQEPLSSCPVECAFCPDLVPQNLMTSHLYLHFLPKKEAEN
uniref:Tbk1/Ikki binding domain-containing protein n=1 Tax=Poecilia mexicana TaxID=48701 RepID=A0A3B3XEZ5_9TELE